MTDLLVVWDGVNDGHDSDLLNVALRIPEKHRVTSEPADRGRNRRLVYDTLPTDRAKALTFREVIGRTGCSADSVNSALSNLRQSGQLQSEPIPGEAFRRSRPPQRYWRSA